MLRTAARRRPAAILMVVVVMLALFLVVGLAFVIFAESAATSSRIYRESQMGGHTVVPITTRGSTEEAPPIPQSIFNTVLGQLIYDVPDDATGVFNSLRGASLARAMYGWNYTGNPATPTPVGNTTPYAGLGKFRGIPLLGVDSGNLVNYAWSGTGVIADPERYNTRTQASASPTANSYIPINAPYTYPDAKDIYLAAVNPSDGRVLTPSFYRQSVFGSLAPGGNWTTATGRYLIHRPRPSDHSASFPLPVANSDGSYGDVENLIGKKAPQLDSLWMDVDLPVRTWRGRQYKPLVAMLVTDVDSRVNLNIHGYYQFRSSSYTSGQGLGPWEVNVQKVVPGAEGTALMTNAQGRLGTGLKANEVYTPDGVKDNSIGIGLFGSTSHLDQSYGQAYYAPIDWDSYGTGRMTWPMTGYFTQPVFPGRFGAGGNAAERINHPSLFNPYLLNSIYQVSGNWTFPTADLRFLSAAWGTDTAAYAQARSGGIAPTALGTGSSAVDTMVNARFLVTPISNDIDRPGAYPWSTDYRDAGRLLTFTAAPRQPLPPTPSTAAQAQAFPSIATSRPDANFPTSADFSADWNSRIAVALGAIDLNRRLADYRSNPAATYETANNVTVASATAAIRDRQLFARDIFVRLCVAVGTRPDFTGFAPGTQGYNTLRYLAQLAVNMVDQIDVDCYSTPFKWTDLNTGGDGAPIATANIGNDWVFGQELSRLVLNEVYTQFENGSDPDAGQPDPDPGLKKPAPMQPENRKATFYLWKHWIEVVNPMTTNTPIQSSAGTVMINSIAHAGGTPLRFTSNGTTVFPYRVQMVKKQTNLYDATNTAGSVPAADVLATIPLDDTTTPIVAPALDSKYSKAAGHPGFRVFGPGDLNGVTPSTTIAGLKLQVAPDRPEPPTYLLQKLLCEHLPESTTNPYVTVDVFDLRNKYQINNAAQIASKNGLMKDGWNPLDIDTRQPLDQRRSYGRKQPLAGFTGSSDPADPTGASMPTDPADSQVVYARRSQNGFYHTFFAHNGSVDNAQPGDPTLSLPFDWYAHYDRALISAPELQLTSAYPPHAFTHRFVGPNSVKQSHLADWASDAFPLWRSLTVLTTRPRVVGLGFGGRVPGKINLNTVYDARIFDAIADGSLDKTGLHAVNFFMATDHPAIWNRFLASRTPSGVPSKDSTDRPLLGFGAPVYAAGSANAPTPFATGIESTLFRKNGGADRVFDVPVANFAGAEAHPYLKNDLYIKMHNNLTNRSNTFAVWMTIGYFEVTNAGPFTNTNRPKLGKELGIDDGTNVRHKFYAVVDRTNLSIDTTNAKLQGSPPIIFSYEPCHTAAGVFQPRSPDPVTNKGATSVVVRVPAGYAANGGAALGGYYDGKGWTLAVGDKLTIGMGAGAYPSIPAGSTAAEETVTVTAIKFTAAGDATATLQFPGTVQHTRGEPILLPVSRLGNPGPQPGFNIKDLRYAGIVPVAEQLK